MQGDLTTICLPDLLRSIYVERRTGELIFSQGEQRKQIFFELGNIVFSASNQAQDRIGEVLLRHGLLSPQDFDRAVEETKSGKRFGKALVEMGIMGERELITNVTFQVLDIIYSLFAWTTGSYQFIEGENRVADELKLKLTTASIILEGVRRIEDFDIIRRGLGDINRLVAPSSSMLLRMQTTSLKPVERKIVDLVTKPTDLLKILIATDSAPELTLKSMYGLLSAGILEQTQAAELSHRTGKFAVPDEIASQPAPPPPAAPRPPSPSPPDFRVFLQDLDMIKGRIAQHNPYIILNVSPAGNLDDLNRAYFQLAERFHPDRFLQAPRELRVEIDGIFRQIIYSYETLKNRILAAAMRPPTTSSYYGTAPLPHPQSYGTQPLVQPNPFPQPTQPLSGYGTAPLAPPQLSSGPGSGSTGSYPAFGSTMPLQQPTGALSQPSKPRMPRPVAYGSAAPAPPPPVEDPADPMSYANREGDKWPENTMTRRPQWTDPSKSTVNMDAAVADLLAYLDDQKAPLFVADSLSILFRTAPPLYMKRERVAEIVAGWALRRASLSGKPIHELMLAAVNNIKHAEQARVLTQFEGPKFYEDFIRELLTYCPPEEHEIFYIKLGGIKELLRK
ncbi:MAG: DUF4388 domain-containing protein [Acidobacteria bacterium]|nr:DUF4388 domain-containing protein [Acidobacteriota bacterium]